MVEKIKALPLPGLRNIKTAIATVLCILLYDYLGRQGVILAIIAAFICMQDSVDKSLITGRDRVLGTILGGVFGCLTALTGAADMHVGIFALVIFVGIVLFIFICHNLLHIKSTIVIGLCAYLIIVFESRSSNVAPVIYAFDRTLDTFIGIVIAFITNVVVFRPHPERFRGHDTVNTVFHYEHRKAEHHKTVKWDAGYTRELYIYPEDSIYQELTFDFRVTRTTSFAEHTHFRQFPGYKRTIMLLEGEMTLRHEGHHEITLGRFEQDCFMGDWDTKCQGKGTDFSIVTGPGLSGKVEPLFKGEKLQLDNGHFISFYCLTDGVRLQFVNEGKVHRESLEKEDYIVVSWFENGAEKFTVEADCDEETEEPLLLLVTCEPKQEDCPNE